MRISVIINNYNYGQFLVDCLDSVLNQILPASEVVVVDDGSTDCSKAVLEPYKDRMTIILKTNGGQASAMNAGFAASSGDWVWFLDADDLLLPQALAEVQPLLRPGLTRLHCPMWICDEAGRICGAMPRDANQLSTGQPLLILREGRQLQVMPTSGNVFARSFLDRVMPIPEERYRICADTHLLFSDLARQHVGLVEKRLAIYRVHGSNHYYRANQFTMDEVQLKRQMETSLHTLELYAAQGLMDGESAPDRYIERFLELSALKNWILLCRLGHPIQQYPDWSVARLRPIAISRIGRLPDPASRLRERINLALVAHAPLRVLPVFAQMEGTVKRVRGRTIAEGEIPA